VEHSQISYGLSKIQTSFKRGESSGAGVINLYVTESYFLGTD